MARARRPNRQHMEVLRERVPYWFVVAFLFVLAAYQILMNPFGLSDLTDRYAQDLSNLLITGPYLYPTTGHDKVSVSLIEDDTLAQLQMPWPWSYGAHARALDSLLALHPKAVVVDILFVDPRKDPTLPQLVNEIGRYKKAGVPLYFTAATDAQPGTEPLRRELEEAGARKIDPTLLINAGIARQYPVTGRCFNGEPASATCYSMALTVYRDLAAKDPSMAPLKVNRDGVMELLWGTRTDPINAKWMHFKGDDGKVAGCNNGLGFFQRIFAAFFDTSAIRSRCPYTGVIPAESLFQGGDDPDVDHLVKNRVVFYGAGLEGAEDRSFTPVNGLIPNVFIHAMALDNLFSLDGRPMQDVVTIAGSTVSNNMIEIAAIIPVILVLAFFHRRRRNKRIQTRAAGTHHELSATAEYFLDKLIGFAWAFLAFALALGAGLAMTLALRLSVANWIDVVLTSLVLAAMLLVGLPDAVWGYLHHIFGGMPDQPVKEEATR